MIDLLLAILGQSQIRGWPTRCVSWQNRVKKPRSHFSRNWRLSQGAPSRSGNARWCFTKLPIGWPLPKTRTKAGPDC